MIQPQEWALPAAIVAAVGAVAASMASELLRQRAARSRRPKPGDPVTAADVAARQGQAWERFTKSLEQRLGEIDAELARCREEHAKCREDQHKTRNRLWKFQRYAWKMNAFVERVMPLLPLDLKLTPPVPPEVDEAA